MTTLEIEGDWNIIKGTHPQKWTMRTDDDLRFGEGTQSELLLHFHTPAGEEHETVRKTTQ